MLRVRNYVARRHYRALGAIVTDQGPGAPPVPALAPFNPSPPPAFMPPPVPVTQQLLTQGFLFPFVIGMATWAFFGDAIKGVLGITGRLTARGVEAVGRRVGGGGGGGGGGGARRPPPRREKSDRPRLPPAGRPRTELETEDREDAARPWVLAVFYPRYGWEEVGRYATRQEAERAKRAEGPGRYEIRRET